MIGILFESDEWSDYKLAAELENRGFAAALINTEEPDNETQILSCDLLVSRVFASATFRDHSFSLERMPHLLNLIKQQGIPLINPAQAHFYETDKTTATKKLEQVGLSVPCVYACDSARLLEENDFSYPCIIKPNCGGRSTYTALAQNPSQARSFLDGVPNLVFVVEEYIRPEKGFLTRVEIVGYECALILKRSVAENGLSSYHFGSTYTPYHEPSDALLKDCALAARELSIELGSFDIIESGTQRSFIDANAVSNVSEDCTELFDFDLMSAYADYITDKYQQAKTC
jgi:ribosomal protein S6--L-glutamate ligase